MTDLVALFRNAHLLTPEQRGQLLAYLKGVFHAEVARRWAVAPAAFVAGLVDETISATGRASLFRALPAEAQAQIGAVLACADPLRALVAPTVH